MEQVSFEAKKHSSKGNINKNFWIVNFFARLVKAYQVFCAAVFHLIEEFEFHITKEFEILIHFPH